MQSNKVVFLVFGVLALVLSASLSAEAVEQESEGISDRRYRWASEEDNSEDSQDLEDAEDQGNNPSEDGTWEEAIIEYVPAGTTWEDLESGSAEA
ncbi:uncharacterized protein LOC111077660 [Drosophila obscura]|uniref:uncharacterized protein LOC111077660 n=1 Tax=Drosophila obscura TaxID=7282 RepID=UPI001BB106BD|nr:uncharacterized protein LOC111077660 [Drosophila obscura]